MDMLLLHRQTHKIILISVLISIWSGFADANRFLSSSFQVNPYDSQISKQLTSLRSVDPVIRAGAAESLGFMRAYGAADALAQSLNDESEVVRRQAAMALAWCGQKGQVNALLKTLEDMDWTVRQSAWVSLTNLTGMEFPFDALAGQDVRKKQVSIWRQWWNSVREGKIPNEISDLLTGDDLNGQLRAVRAVGSIGEDGASEIIVRTIEPYLEREYRRISDTEKNIVQCGLRSLGRLREQAGFEVLLSFLDTEGWARYAADALGDFGDPGAVQYLIKAYPQFSRNLQDRHKNPERCPSDDRFSGDNTQDRMHETPYAIAFAMSRLPLDDPKDITALKEITPYLVANLPTSWDSGVFYEIESAQFVTAYLLEKAQMRQRVCDIAFNSVDKLFDAKRDIDGMGKTPEEIISKLALRMYGDVPDIATWFPAYCRHNDVDRLIGLLEHDNGWVVINVVKALMFIGDKRAIEPIGKLLAESKTEAEWGYSGALEHAEYNDPTPRRREAYIRAIGRLGAVQYGRMLADIIKDQRNVVDIHHASALAMDELGCDESIRALQYAEQYHPFSSVRLVAREALWRRGLLVNRTLQVSEPSAREVQNTRAVSVTEKQPESIVFIKGNNKVRSDFNGQAGVDPWRQAYTITNSGPTMRVGRNLHILRLVKSDGEVIPLTSFKKGFVADCEVSWDGKKIIFSRRINDDERNYRQVKYKKAELKGEDEPLLGGMDDPWWHVWEINVDGTGLRQLTFGPYHDVNPVYLPDGRVVFSSSRLGLRDEYHGYPCIGLSVMNADGSDIHPIGFNLGGDRDPAITADGRIVFSRIDIIYSRLKTEVALHSVFPDGTKNESLYGPERRPFWRKVHLTSAAWWMRPGYGGSDDNRNRVLRISQPQSMSDGRIICTSSGGLFITGPGRNRENLVPHDRKYAITSPFPLGEDKILCSASIKQFKVDGRIITCGEPQFEKLEKGEKLFRSAINIDLGIYTMDVKTGWMEPVYNDPAWAEFEARPIMARPRPVMLSEEINTRRNLYTARLFCNSAKVSRHKRVTERGKLVRVIEGRGVVSRHETQQNRPTNRWKNHGGTHARVLGTVPLAADGSFHIEVPADRLLQLQILDSDRRVLGNQLFWMYARPGETRSCVGCHENRDKTHLPDHFAVTAKIKPVKVLPSGDEFSYRAKAWLKGTLPDEAEERMRTVRAVKLIGRY